MGILKAYSGLLPTTLSLRRVTVSGKTGKRSSVTTTISFDFMDSEGYIQRKADASISSKDFYEIYRMWCEENSLAPLKARSFSDAMIANARKFNLEHCNNITNSAGRRVWGFMGVEAIARPHINGFYGDSPCTYVPEDIPEEWRQVE
mgnify:CR=1 FL=1